jgi:hypothetical protein
MKISRTNNFSFTNKQSKANSKLGNIKNDLPKLNHHPLNPAAASTNTHLALMQQVNTAILQQTNSTDFATMLATTITQTLMQVLPNSFPNNVPVGNTLHDVNNNPTSTAASSKDKNGIQNYHSDSSSTETEDDTVKPVQAKKVGKSRKRRMTETTNKGIDENWCNTRSTKVCISYLHNCFYYS